LVLVCGEATTPPSGIDVIYPIFVWDRFRISKFMFGEIRILSAINAYGKNRERGEVSLPPPTRSLTRWKEAKRPLWFSYVETIKEIIISKPNLALRRIHTSGTSLRHTLRVSC
jgi:hypothetical protein